MGFNRNIYSFQNRLFDIVVYVTWVLYIVTALGLSANAPQYLDILHIFIKLYVSFFLIYRFNPFRRVKFTALDAKIAFSAGFFLLTTTAIDGLLKTYLSKGVKSINEWF